MQNQHDMKYYSYQELAFSQVDASTNCNCDTSVVSLKGLPC